MTIAAIRVDDTACETLTALSDGDHNTDRDHRTCSRRYCRQPALDDAEYCARHDADVRRYQRAYGQRRRAEWEAAKRCMRCGAKERKPGRPWCPACAIRLDTMRKRDHKSDRDHLTPWRDTHAARVAARMTSVVDSSDGYARQRMKGGKRGAPSMESRDRQDLQHIRLVLADYEQAIGEAYAVDVRELSREAQRSAREAAHAGLALAVRLGMEALVRYGYEAPVLHPDEIGDSDEDDDT